MTKPRSEQIALDSTSFYHCYVRCVRKAFLCGDDFSTGENYDHRKQWIASRLRFLSDVYAIDICAYAVMSNHYHVVLHVDVDRAKDWTAREVAERWMRLFNGNVLIRRWLCAAAEMDKGSLVQVAEIIEEWRERLTSISWFMRGVNETVARMANEEEGCKGRFWEGRFKSQALLDEGAVLSCMAYVDLNPIRAGMEKDLSTSDFTSIQQRLADYVSSGQAKDNQEQVSGSGNLQEGNGGAEKSAVALGSDKRFETMAKILNKRMARNSALKSALGLESEKQAALMAFDGSAHTSVHVALPFTLEDYFDLVDKTGRAIVEGKRGFIDAQVPSVISQMGIEPDKWIQHIQCYGSNYSACSGNRANIVNFAEAFGRRWGKGSLNSSAVYSSHLLKAGGYS